MTDDINPPGSLYGWGYPEFGAPSARIVTRTAQPGTTNLEQAIVEVSIGDPVVFQHRFLINGLAADEGDAAVRSRAFRSFVNRTVALARHLDHLADAANGREETGIWAGETLRL